MYHKIVRGNYMDFYIILLVFVALLFSLCWVRAFIVRLNMLRKIKKSCKENGYTLTRTGSLFALNGSDRVSLKIEKENTVYMIKLMGSLHKLETFYLNTRGTYNVQRIIPLMGGWGGSITHTKEGRERLFPKVDWLSGEEEELFKHYIPVYLFCPVPMEVRVIQGDNDDSPISDATGPLGVGYLGKLKTRRLSKDREDSGWAWGGYRLWKGSKQLHSGETYNGGYIFGTKDFQRVLESGRLD